MPKFIIETKRQVTEYWKYTVEAESLEAAKQQVLEGFEAGDLTNTIPQDSDEIMSAKEAQ